MAPGAITRSRLAADLRTIGLREGAIATVHARMSAIGWVVGGSGGVFRPPGEGGGRVCGAATAAGSSTAPAHVQDG